MFYFNFSRLFYFEVIILLCFSTLFYTSSPINMHYMAGSNMGIRGYADFHYPRTASLYNYDDKERSTLIHTRSTQTLRGLATSVLFSDRDRAVLCKQHFMHGHAIHTKDSLSLPPCPWIYQLEGRYFSLQDTKRYYSLSYFRPFTEERKMK